MADTIDNESELNPENNQSAYLPEELMDWPRDNLAELDSSRLSETSDYAVAQFLERLEIDEARDLLRELSIDHVSDILSEMDEESAAEILSAIRDRRASKILDSFEPDDAADIVAELDAHDRKRLLGGLPSENRVIVENLLAYDPESAGGIMTTSVDYAYDDMSVNDAIELIRSFAEHHDDLHYVYIVDRDHRLKGTLSLRKLIQGRPTQQLKDLMRIDLRGVVPPETDQEVVAHLMAEYNLPDIAVVDQDNVLLGIITHDDVIDVIQEEATEDIQKLVGAGGDENLQDDILYSVQRRQPWLGLNLVTAFIAAAVVLIFRTEIGTLPILAGLMPIIAGVGGNSGQQALAVAIRSIALGQVQMGDGRIIVLKQMAIGLINGACIGLAAGIVVYLFEYDYAQKLLLSVIVAVAMILNMLLAGLAGAFVPLFLHSIKRDPAQSSSILLTAITDTGGFFIFLGLGSWLLL